MQSECSVYISFSHIQQWFLFSSFCSPSAASGCMTALTFMTFSPWYIATETHPKQRVVDKYQSWELSCQQVCYNAVSQFCCLQVYSLIIASLQTHFLFLNTRCHWMTHSFLLFFFSVWFTSDSRAFKVTQWGESLFQSAVGSCVRTLLRYRWWDVEVSLWWQMWDSAVGLLPPQVWPYVPDNRVAPSPYCLALTLLRFFKFYNKNLQQKTKETTWKVM